MGSFKHLSEFERGKIELMWKQGHKQAEIARELNRSRSTISREIIRSQEYQDYERYSPKRRQHMYRYNALIAQNNARHRKLKIGRNTKLTDEMKAAIIEGYKKKWSPEQIVNADSRVSVCVNTVYNWILRGFIKELDRRLVKRYRKKSARKYRALGRNESEMVLKRSIEQRPSVINKRERLGDWEIDCVLPSREGKKCIVTLTERKSRYTFMALAASQSGSSMIPVIDTFMSLHGDAVHSITCDRGREFANSTFISCIERNYHKKVYFTHAYAPQERGTNENTNGLIRAYLPKKQTFESQSQFDIIHIANQLNTRPKKIHGFKTCAEIFKNEVLKLERDNAYIPNNSV